MGVPLGRKNENEKSLYQNGVPAVAGITVTAKYHQAKYHQAKYG
jgi:hypothetical protein